LQGRKNTGAHDPCYSATLLCLVLPAFGQPLPEEPDLLLYRLLTGLTEAITACLYLRRDLL